MKPDSSPLPDENSPNPGAGSHGQKGPQDLREHDLWDFADDPDTPPETALEPENVSEKTPPSAEAAPQQVTVTPRGLRKEELPFRAKQPPKLRKGPKEETKAEGAPEALPISISKSPAQPPRRVEDAFDDLDSSDEPPASGAPVESPKKEVIPAKVEPRPAPEPQPAPEPEAPVSEAEAPPAESHEETVKADEPAAPALSPSPIIPRLSLSKVERIALISVLALLAIGSIFFIANSVYKIPEKHVWLKEGDFPIKGTRIEAVKVQTFWRAPAAGEGRIGTALLPVIDLEIAGGPAAVRVFFRNAKGESAGDAFTRSVSGSTHLKIAATAGFDDLGMHAAYRTTDSDRWIVEVFEGPSVDAPIETFKKLFELPISTDRR